MPSLRHFAPYRAARAFRVVAPTIVGYLALRTDDAAGWERAHQRATRRIAKLAEDLGGVFVKMCQVIGSRADIMPPIFVSELGRFVDKVRPRPLGELAGWLERELGRPLDKVFRSIDELPVAAASIAQVHRAELLDGAVVAVKIQYPEVRGDLTTDLGNIRRAAWVASRLFRDFPLFPALHDVTRFIELELDFEREARSLARAGMAFKDDPDVRVPALYAELSTAKVIVQEFLDGTPVHDFETLRAKGIETRDVADRIGRIYGRMLFEHGFFHGDPHAGNLLVLRDGRIGLLDFGLVRELPPGFGRAITGMFGAAMVGDADRAVADAQQLGFRLEGVEPAAFQRFLRMVLGEQSDVRDVFKIATDGLSGPIPEDIALVTRTLVILNGLSEQLAPGERRIVRGLMEGAGRTLSAA
ncbi:MAG TPA: AarF/ABC1/UbiB kinase family protein [Caulobacteraceae bacterium]|jgi:ubiquinone biosynthesis protein